MIKNISDEIIINGKYTKTLIFYYQKNQNEIQKFVKVFVKLLNGV